MHVDDLLARYRCTPIDPAAQSAYVGFALSHFRTPAQSADPELSCCVQLDLTAADAVYRQHFASVRGASCTAYLTWRMLQATAAVAPLLWRWIAGRWYHMADPPFFCPVATGTANTFRHVVLEGVVASTWPDFVRRYRTAVDDALAAPLAPAPVDPDIYRVACFIGNLPYLAFTALRLHRQVDPSGRIVCYFGKRGRSADGTSALTCPLAIQFDHANADPWQVNRLLEAFSAALIDTAHAGRPAAITPPAPTG